MNKHINYIPYQLLSTTIDNIDIGVLNDIHPSLSYDLPPDEIREGNYRENFYLVLLNFIWMQTANGKISYIGFQISK